MSKFLKYSLWEYSLTKICKVIDNTFNFVEMTSKTEVVLILLQKTLKPPSMVEEEHKIYRKN